MGEANGSCNNTKSDPWELNEYEKQRKCHEPITDPDKEIIINPRSLMNELMCPICLDILRNTMTAKECLHRFCHDCITTALRSVNKECPTCRKKLVSRRSLRADPNFDDLIAKIYPNRDELDAVQERALSNLTRDPSNAALQRSIEEGMRVQAQVRRHKRPYRSGPGAMGRQLSLNNTPASSSSAADPFAFDDTYSEGFDEEGGLLRFLDRTVGVSGTGSISGSTPGRKRKYHSRESSFDPSASEASSSGISGLLHHTKEVELILHAHPGIHHDDSEKMPDRFVKTSAKATDQQGSSVAAASSDGAAEGSSREHSRDSGVDLEPFFKIFTCDDNRFTELAHHVSLEAVAQQVASGSAAQSAARGRRPLKLFFSCVTDTASGEEKEH